MYIVLRSKILKIKEPYLTNVATNTSLNDKINKVKNRYY